jgi:hypothetical protein
MEKKQDLTPPKAKRTPPSSSAVSNGQDRPKQEVGFAFSFGIYSQRSRDLFFLRPSGILSIALVHV